VAEQDAALRSIHAALKPLGRALLRMVPGGPRKSVEDVYEEVRGAERWASHFRDFRKPFVHFMPEEYRILAERAGFRIERLRVDEKSWDFETCEAFAGFCRATFVEWTRRLPEGDRGDFIAEVLDRCQSLAATGPKEANTFMFYQMQVALERPAGAM
jgi:hypothetical protein